MLIAFNENKDMIFSEDAEKSNIYTCPHCDEKVIFKKGRKKIPHFAHQPNSACIFKSEHYNHLRFKFFCKKNLNFILGINYTIDIEKPLKLFDEIRIADVVIKELRVVLEFQHSNIQPDDWRKRTAFYKNFKLRPIWIFDIDSFGKISDNKESIKVPTIFVYLRKFYPIYLFNIDILDTIYQLLLFQKKQVYRSLTIYNGEYDNYWHVIEKDWVDYEQGYYETLKTTFEYTIKELTWNELLTKGENQFE